MSLHQFSMEYIKHHPNSQNSLEFWVRKTQLVMRTEKYQIRKYNSPFQHLHSSVVFFFEKKSAKPPQMVLNLYWETQLQHIRKIVTPKKSFSSKNADFCSVVMNSSAKTYQKAQKSCSSSLGSAFTENKCVVSWGKNRQNMKARPEVDWDSNEATGKVGKSGFQPWRVCS